MYCGGGEVGLLAAFTNEFWGTWVSWAETTVKIKMPMIHKCAGESYFKE